MRIRDIIYIPLLHRALAPAEVPESVKFMDPGLGLPPAGATWLSPALPLGRTEASAALREMLELGSTLSRGRHAPGGALAQWENQKPVIRRTLPGAEKDALERFSMNGRSAPDPGEMNAAERPASLLGAHKVLLLAWELEENLLEIGRAEETLTGKNRLLQATLHGGAENAPNEPALTDQALPDWRVILEAAAPFLPDEAVLLSFSPCLRADLQERAPDFFRPPPDDLLAALAERPGFAALCSRLAWARRPLHEFLDSPAAWAEKKPWLGKTCELLVMLGYDKLRTCL